jgi:hypothetical protein
MHVLLRGDRNGRAPDGVNRIRRKARPTRTQASGLERTRLLDKGEGKFLTGSRYTPSLSHKKYISFVFIENKFKRTSDSHLLNAGKSLNI